METYEKRIAALQAVEVTLMEAVTRLQSTQRLYDLANEGGDLQVRVGRRLMTQSIEVRNVRRDYAQAVLNAYAVGMTTNGQILWS
jgi:hypothetical protein